VTPSLSDSAEAQFEKPQVDGAAAKLSVASIDDTAGCNDGRARAVTQPKRLPGLTVFLPSHNEEGNVERVVANFLG